MKKEAKDIIADHIKAAEKRIYAAYNSIIKNGKKIEEKSK